MNENEAKIAMDEITELQQALNEARAARDECARELDEAVGVLRDLLDDPQINRQPDACGSDPQCDECDQDGECSWQAAREFVTRPRPPAPPEGLLDWPTDENEQEATSGAVGPACCRNCRFDRAGGQSCDKFQRRPTGSTCEAWSYRVG